MPNVSATSQDLIALDRAQDDLLNKLRMSVDINNSLSTEQKKLLCVHIERLKKSFRKAIINADVQALTDQLYLFESAYYLGAYKTLSPGIFENVVKTTQRMNAIIARAGRSAPPFQEYLKKIANKFWQKNKSFVGNFEGTAEKILDQVYKNIATVDGVPPQIRDKDITNKIQRKQAVHTIGKRLKKLSTAHDY